MVKAELSCQVTKNNSVSHTEMGGRWRRRILGEPVILESRKGFVSQHTRPAGDEMREEGQGEADRERTVHCGV